MKLCSVDGCERPHHAKGWCGTHHERWRRHGDPSVVLVTGRKRSSAGSVGSKGYLSWASNDHPLSTRGGRLAVHRAVLYGVIGPGVHPCHWCQRPVDWGLTWPQDGPGALVVDHLDGVPLNNDPANLVASCQPCNATRQHRRSS